MSQFQNKQVLLIVGGGIAAYKTLELVRLLTGAGAGVRAVLTEGGAQFVTPLSLGTLTGTPVFTDLFDLGQEVEIGHIRLSREADIVVVAPATADLLAKMAAGLAGDLATCVLLATDKPVLVAPAMNVRMWHHGATQRSLKTLASDGVQIVGPGEGDMACGEFGLGRMAEPAQIMTAIGDVLARPADGPLAGKTALVTSGPTHEPIDPVRYLANRSSGKQGHALAAALARAGAATTLVTGPTNLPDPAGVTITRVETARQMLAACEATLPVEIAIFAAAVADWRVEEAPGKIKKVAAAENSATPKFSLIENPDILATIAQRKNQRPGLVIGFAAETEDVVANAQKKRARKACDWIVANDVSAQTGVFGSDQNQVHIVSDAAVEDWPRMTKVDVANRLVARIAKMFNQP
ncbi:MAG: bifunctional phosphopantothenoylcysteine decarboxylase/phosphopantothenate--cysteine ligase CoaBC [Alphaproteobacteria bacterium]